MLRTWIAGIGAAALLSAGFVGAPAGAEVQPYGSTSANTQELKPRCAYYHYRYKVTVPSDNWAAEMFLFGPDGGGVSSDAQLSSADPDVGVGRFRLCRASLIAGRYKIRMKVTYKIGYDKFEGFVKPSTFRLVRAR